MKVRTVLSLVAAHILVAGSAQAGLITANTLVDPTTVDFSQFVAAPVVNAVGPIQIGGLVGEDIQYTGDPNSGLYAWNLGWILADNGEWDAGLNGFLGQNDARPGTMIMSFFDGPVSGVGAFMNHCPSGLDCDGSPLVISAFDSTDTLLESYNITLLANISTPNGVNAGAFRGIQRASSDIASFQISGYVPVIDDLAFSRAQVPEPTSLVLLAFGLGLLGFWRRRG